jgi:hypothetical protein
VKVSPISSVTHFMLSSTKSINKINSTYYYHSVREIQRISVFKHLPVEPLSLSPLRGTGQRRNSTMTMIMQKIRRRAGWRSGGRAGRGRCYLRNDRLYTTEYSILASRISYSEKHLDYHSSPNSYETGIRI